MEEREAELIDYLRVLWRRKAIIIIAFLAAVASAWIASSTLPKTYSAKTSLLLLPPLATELEAATSGSTLTGQVCQRLATSSEILQTVASGIGLPSDTDITAFSERVSVSVQALSMSGEQQFLLDASFRAPDPDTAVRMGLAWIAAFSTTYEGVFQDRTTRSYDYVSQNAASTRQALEDAMARRTTLLLEHPISLLTSDIAAIQTRYQGGVTELAASQRELESNEARVAALEHELAQQASVVVLERSLDPDTLAIALQSGLSSRGFDELLSLRSQEESENTTFVSLTRDAAYARARSEELRKQIEVLELAVASGRAELDQRQKEAIETQAALDTLDSEVQLLQGSYARLAAKLLDARIALAETAGPIRVVNDLIAPTVPSSPGMTTSVPIAGFLGLLVGVALALFFDYLSRARKAPDQAQVMRTRESDRGGLNTPARKDD